MVKYIEYVYITVRKHWMLMEKQELTEIVMTQFLTSEHIYSEPVSSFAPCFCILFHAQQIHFRNSPIDVIHLWAPFCRKQGLQSAHSYLCIIISSQVLLNTNEKKHCLARIWSTKWMIVQLLNNWWPYFFSPLKFIIYISIYLVSFKSLNQMAKKPVTYVLAPEANEDIILYLRSGVYWHGFFLYTLLIILK